MALRIIWSELALHDLRSIVTYIARDDGETARKFGFKLIGKVGILTRFPFVGRIVAEFKDENLRELVLSPYRIVYEVDANSGTVSVLRIWHSARGNLDL